MMDKISSLLLKIKGVNKFMAICSLIVSFILWFSLTLVYNPVSQRTIANIPINIDIENTAVSNLGLEIISTDSQDLKASVKISGKTASVSSVTAADISVTPQLSSVSGAGEYELSLVATKTSLLSDFDILSVEPEKIKVTLDKVVTKSFPVNAKAIDASAPEGLIAEDATVTDAAFSNIEITGAQTEINKISSVVARAVVGKTLKETSEFQADIVLLDKDGKELDRSNLKMGFEKANITVAISKIKTVDIVPTFTNAPADYEKKSLSYKLDVTSVDVIGPPEIIDKLTYVSLEPIDFNEISLDNNKFTCAIRYPTSVKSHENIEKVTVTLDLSEMSKSSINVSRSKITNLQEGLSASVSGGVSNVTVIGPKSALNDLKSSDLYISVDLADYNTKGTYTVPAKIIVDGASNVWTVGEYKVVVKLS